MTVMSDRNGEGCADETFYLRIDLDKFNQCGGAEITSNHTNLTTKDLNGIWRNDAGQEFEVKDSVITLGAEKQNILDDHDRFRLETKADGDVWFLPKDAQEIVWRTRRPGHSHTIRWNKVSGDINQFNGAWSNNFGQKFVVRDGVITSGDVTQKILDDGDRFRLESLDSSVWTISKKSIKIVWKDSDSNQTVEWFRQGDEDSFEETLQSSAPAPPSYEDVV